MCVCGSGWGVAHARWLWPRKSPSVSVWSVLPLRRSKREEPVIWNRGEIHHPPLASLQDCLETFHRRIRVVLCRRRRVSLSCGASLLQTRIGNHYACGSPAISAEMSGYQGKKNIPRITVSTDRHEWWAENTMKWWQRLLTGAEIHIMASECWNNHVLYLYAVRFCGFTVLQLCQYLYIRCWITVTSRFNVTYIQAHFQMGFFVGQRLDPLKLCYRSHYYLVESCQACMHYKTGLV